MSFILQGRTSVVVHEGSKVCSTQTPHATSCTLVSCIRKNERTRPVAHLRRPPPLTNKTAPTCGQWTDGDRDLPTHAPPSAEAYCPPHPTADAVMVPINVIDMCCNIDREGLPQREQTLAAFSPRKKSSARGVPTSRNPHSDHRQPPQCMAGMRLNAPARHRRRPRVQRRRCR